MARVAAGRWWRWREPGIRGHQAAAGWLFIAPVIIILGVFLAAADRHGGLGELLRLERQRQPVRRERALRRPRELPPSADDARARSEQLRHGDSATTSTTSLLVVPIQTAVALFLAVLVNRRLKGVGFFRTAFYFPSVTSSVAITVLFLFLFSPTGVINKLLSFFGATGPAWLYDPRGLFHVILDQFGVHQSTSLSNQFFLGVSYWDWLSGPSIAMCVFIIMAVFTTSGTFMLLFLAALQSIDESVNEAAALDGASEWRKFRHITVPMIRPMLFTVVTLGLIGTWQIFDQIYVGTKGEPVEHDVDAGVPVVQRLVQQQQLGRGRRDRVHPLRDHRLLHARDAAPHPQPGPRAATAPLRPDAGSRQPGRVACRSAAPEGAP